MDWQNMEELIWQTKMKQLVTATTIFSIWFDKLQMQWCDITIWNKKADQVWHFPNQKFHFQHNGALLWHFAKKNDEDMIHNLLWQKHGGLDWEFAKIYLTQKCEKENDDRWDGLHRSVEGKEGGDLMGQLAKQGKTNPKRTLRTGSLAHF